MSEISASDEISTHASAVAVRESGVLIRGPSRSGKSALALALLSLARQQGAFAALIGDDRVLLRRANGVLSARGVAATTGLVERRYIGIIETRTEAAAIVRLVIDLCERDSPPPRLPGAGDCIVDVCGVELPRMRLDSWSGPITQAYAILECLGNMPSGKFSSICNFA